MYRKLHHTGFAFGLFLGGKNQIECIYFTHVILKR